MQIVITEIKNDGKVSFVDNSNENIMVIDNVSKDSSTFIVNVCLVKNLKHNLLSVNQFYDKGYGVIFYKKKCIIENSCNGKVLLVRKRCVNVYTIDINCASSHDKYFF